MPKRKINKIARLKHPFYKNSEDFIKRHQNLFNAILKIFNDLKKENIQYPELVPEHAIEANKKIDFQIAKALELYKLFLPKDVYNTFLHIINGKFTLKEYKDVLKFLDTLNLQLKILNAFADDLGRNEYVLKNHHELGIWLRHEFNHFIMRPQYLLIKSLSDFEQKHKEEIRKDKQKSR